MIRKFRKYLLAVAILASAFCAWKFADSKTVVQLAPTLANGPALIVDSLVFAAFCLVMTFAYVSKRFKMKNVLFTSSLLALWTLVLPAGVYAVSIFNEITSLMISIIYVFVTIVFLVIYVNNRKRAGDKVSSTAIRKSAVGSGQIRYAYSIFFALLLILAVAFVSEFVFTIVQKGQITPPMMLGTVLMAYILWRLIRWRGFLLAEVIFLTYTEISNIIDSITLNNQPVVTDIGYFLIAVAAVTVLSDLYCRKEKSI